MKLIIGGSSSTGSSLFRQLLNRHSAIFCAPETYLFCHPKLYTDWEASKHLIFKNKFNPLARFQDGGVMLFDQILLNNNELHFPEQKMQKEILHEAPSLHAFSNRLFSYSLAYYQKKIWAEKTPANANCFALLEASFSDVYCIHTIRHPYDTIDSMMRRGHSLYYATALYLYHCAQALRMRNAANYIEIKYEDLVMVPETSLASVLKPMELKLEMEMLAKGNDELDESEQLKGWEHKETDKVKSSGAYRLLDTNPEKCKLIQSAIQTIQLSSEYAKSMGIEFINIEQLSKYFDYKLHEVQTPDKAVQNQIKQEQKAYLFQRKSMLNFKWNRQYPIQLCQ